MPERDTTRRQFTLALMAGLLAGCDRKDTHLPESPTMVKARLYAERHLPPGRRDWLLRAAAEVERDYTTDIVRIPYRGRVYEIPANFYTMTARAAFRRYARPGGHGYEILDAGESIAGWHFFWPEIQGYTLDNWFDPNDRRLIRYSSFVLAPPASRRMSTRQVFEHVIEMDLIEAVPSVELHGLQGHRYRNAHDYLWVGQRADGEMFTMSSFHPYTPGDLGGRTNPQCKVKLQSALTGEEVAYFYPLELFMHWREIDRQTQDRIQSWRVA